MSESKDYLPSAVQPFAFEDIAHEQTALRELRETRAARAEDEQDIGLARHQPRLVRYVDDHID
jgi:hypothetical protein